MKHRLLLVLVLVVPAVLMTPLQQKIHAERIQMRYGGAQPTIEMREILSQELWVALLAGFRGVVADFLWNEGHGHWEKGEWVQMYRCMDWVTRLQPQSVLFWDLSAWEMAWNISYAMRTDPANHTQAEGIKHEREWIDEGRKFLERGVANVPNRYELYKALGDLWRLKYQDYQRAAHYYGLAAQFGDAPSFVSRMYARALEKSGEPDLAYEYWKKIWQHGADTKAHPRGIVEWEIRRLENLLGIADEQRVFPRKPAKTAEVS